ncbi:MAG TPA: amidohydrolase family protein [Candidatus Nitrosocosmicus sp.]|nr:amidohydrolase family protein [Candidatus Nitrosocosmicus sp.]
MKKLLIKNAYILYGKELQIVQNGSILINQYGTIEDVFQSEKDPEKENNAINGSVNKNNKIDIIDAEGFILVPGLINSHVHIGDSIGKDISASSDLNQRIHPQYGIKKTILESTPKSQLMQMIRNTAMSMLHKGITTFVDFREGGLEGINLIQNAVENIPIKKIILGRIDFNADYENTNNSTTFLKNSKNTGLKSQTLGKSNLIEENDVINQGGKIIENCDGFGISGANEHTDEMLQLYNKIILKYERIREREQTKLKSHRKKPVVAIHAAEAETAVMESVKKYKKTEIERTVSTLNPHIYIHVTNPSNSDLQLIYQNKKKIVICPRANGVLGTGLVPIRKMLDFNLELGIGTDNVMINSPDMFREMDFLIKSQRAVEKDTKFLDARKVLEMATVNGGRIFGLNIGTIDKGFQADLLFIDKYDLDLYPIHDPHMSIVHRCTERQLKAVMIDGNFVLEKTSIR